MERWGLGVGRGMAISDVSRHDSLLRINSESGIKLLAFDKGFFFFQILKDFPPIIPLIPPV